MTVVAQLKALLGLDTSQYKAGLRDATGATQGFGASLAGIGRTLGVAFSAAAVVTMGKALVSWASNVSQAAQNAGVLTSEMLALNRVALQNGLEVGDMQRLLAKLQNELYQAAGGSKEAAKKFADLGLSVRDLAGMDPASMLQKVAQAALDSGMPLQTISDLFGDRLGPNATSFFKQIAEGFPAMDAAIGETADRIEELGDKWTVAADKAKTAVMRMLNFIERLVSEAGAFWGGMQNSGGWDKAREQGARAIRDQRDGRANESAERTRATRDRQKRASDELVKLVDKTAAEKNEKRMSEVEKASAPFLKKEMELRARMKERLGFDPAKTQFPSSSSADALARVGGMVGGQRGAMGVADRQLRIMAEQTSFLKEIAENTSARMIAEEDAYDKASR